MNSTPRLLVGASLAAALAAALFLQPGVKPERAPAREGVALGRSVGSGGSDGSDRAGAFPAAPVAAPTTPAERARVLAAAVRGEASAAFYRWTADYLAADAAEKPTLAPEGRRLAEARRAEFRAVIQTDPRRALAEAVPMVVRQRLPEQIVQRLEARLNGVAALRVYQGAPMPGAPRPEQSLTVRKAEFKNGKTYRAYVYGRRAESVRWQESLSLNGVAIDADMAVNEQPLRVLEVGEVPDPTLPAVTVCPVSGVKTAGAALAEGQEITEETPAVQTATEVVHFCGPLHIDPYTQTLIMGEGVSGGAFGYTGLLPSAPTPALGVVKVLAIPMTFADQNTVPSTEAALSNTLRDVGDFYAKASFGRLTLVGVVSPPVKLPHNEAWYVNRDTSNGGDIDGEGLEHAHAREEARKLGFDSNDYDCIVVRHNGGPGAYGGLGGGSSVWVRSDGAGLWAHEIGHCFALAHSNFWDTAGTSAIGAGTNQEYGDTYDIMGGSPFPAGQYNAQAKTQIKWMPPNFVRAIAQSGQYRLYAFDQSTLQPDRDYAFTITKDAQKTYWGEVRSLFDTNPWVKNGVLLGWRYPSGSGSNLQRIDVTPGSPFGKEDAAISLGSTFSDQESGIHVTTIAVNDSPRSADVVVNFGQFPGNQPPTLAVAASAEVVPVGATVSFTAMATDPDGDALAYSWQHFGDTGVKLVSGNAPVITRTFSSAGTYVVGCTVTDMKGGTTTRTTLVTVGNGNGRFTISGRVTRLGQGLQDVVITANGSNGVVTDADGYFTIPNLTANTYTLTPLLYGYTFGELFNNSVTVGPSTGGANFEATATPVVTIAASVPAASEAAPVTPGRFTITRTGDPSQALLVNVNTAQGSATKGTDYNIAPDYAAGSQGFSTFTVPAGAASLDVVVTPLVDTAIEGPETVTLQLGPGNGYLVGAQSTASVAIHDDDATVPKVSLAATIVSTIENAGQPAVFTVTRTGATTAALTVKYSVSGTATPAVDFAALAGEVVIPSGADAATVVITPTDDATSEPMETVRLTLTSDVAYLTDPLATQATVRLIDDDVQTVTVVATDPNAKEVDVTVPGAVPDTGTFVITRSGDTSSPLTVYYAIGGMPGSGVPALHGVDFDALPGVLVIPAGADRASVTIKPRLDNFGEGPEQVVLALGAGSTNYVLGSPGAATVTITDAATDVPYLDVVNLTSAAEPTTGGTFRITVRGGSGTGNLGVNFALSGSAVAGTDFNITGTNNTTTGTTIALNNGATVTRDVIVTPIDDAEAEDLEEVTLTITPSANYTTFPATAAATMWLRDNEQPTVYVDTQVGTNGSSTFTEGATTSPLKFYVSRTGATTNPLTVNYTIGGTATAGSDFTALSGMVTIAAGSLGVDVPVVITNDLDVEGTETITFDFAPGSYASGPGAVMYIADNETPTRTVAFQSPSSSGSEANTTVNIPVTLSSAATTPVSVEYTLAGSATGSTAASATPHPLPYWVRLVRNGATITFFESNDGNFWTPRGGALSVPNLSSATYYAGLAVASGSATASTAAVDNFTITGLSGTGEIGATGTVNLGNATGGAHTFIGDVYNFSTPGNGILSASASDNFRFVYFPITNSTACTVTARIVSLGTTATNARVGVMLRQDVTTQGAVYAAAMANGGAAFIGTGRLTANANSAAQTTLVTPVLPMWFRLSRAGDVFASAWSKDGTAWTTFGATPTIALGPKVIAGLAVSARSDGALTTATFDNVTVTPAVTNPLLGREVGFVNADGSVTGSGSTWTVTGSGGGIGGTNDEAHLLAAEVAGDFTMIGRVTSISGGAANAQAGLMMRQDRTHYARQMHTGYVASGSLEQQFRAQSVTTAFGSGVDYALAPGVITFAPGETTKNITFTVANDNMREPNNTVTLQLQNASGAGISGTANLHGYTIVDDDTSTALPAVAFAAGASSVSEAAGVTTLLVSLSEPATNAVTVDYAVTGGSAVSDVDYTLAAGTVTFGVGESVRAIPVTVLQDVEIEAAETVVVTLTNAGNAVLGGLAAHTLSITDDDFPTVSIAATTPSADESGTPGVFTIARMGSLADALTVNFTRAGTATSGTDYTTINTPGSVVIPAGVATAAVTVAPLQDISNEGIETVILTLTANAAYTLGTATATVTIVDDDRSTVTIVANDPDASETSGNPGQFTITRTEPTAGNLTVNLTYTGTATSGSDYTTNPAAGTSITLQAGETSRTVSILLVDDAATEGPEKVTVSIAAGSYNIGAASFDSVTIADNDNPPTIFISSPSAQGPLLADGLGLIVTATASDDGAPQPLALAWTQVAGPGTATFESPTSATTAVTFSTAGTYVLRVSASDGQFTVSDQVTVVTGATIAAADWITQDLGPSSSRRGQGLQVGGIFTVSGTGAGYAGGTTDQAHVMVRSVDGDTSLVVRLTSPPANGALAGITMRDLMLRSARRAVLGFVPGTGLQFRTRTTAAAVDTVVTQAGVTLPLWLRLERNATTNEITASYASDASGTPGAWTALGTPTVVTMDARADVGLTVTSNSTANTATAVFDNVTLTPTPVGPAVIAEDASNTPSVAGSGSVTSGTYTIAASPSGYFYGWQFYGDMMLTARHASATSGAGSATSGLRISENLETGAYAHVGRIPTGAYNGYYWRSIAGGNGGGVPTFTGGTRWVRIIRQGNAITAFHAADVSGNPGTWAQLGQPQTVIMTTPVFVGFWVDNASGVGLNTVTFSNLSIVPLNKAPNVTIPQPANVLSPLAIDATVTDDNFPAPPAVMTAWSQRTGPGTVMFSAPTGVDTNVIFSAAGYYRLRLQADDGSVETFREVTVGAYLTGFDLWREQQWGSSGGLNDANSDPGADPDADGLPNLVEYSVGTSPKTPNALPAVSDVATIGADQYLRMTVTRVPNLGGVRLEVQGANNLGNEADWSAAGMVVEQNTPTTLRVRDSVPMGSVPQRYLRLRVWQ